MQFRLGEHGSVFSTRQRGKQFLDELRPELGAGEDVHISFAGVKSISYSFADEFLGGLMSEHRRLDLLIEDAEDSVRRVILGALRKRGIKVNPKDLFDRVA